ncbi:MAG: hypothetical protein OER77_05525 [Myxococcales bacterium]|nr:hypothetical protein [Myxococcales bacterium]
MYRGEIHGFNVFLWREAARTQWGALFNFLSQHIGDTAVEAPAEVPRPYVSLMEAFAE